jgi:hypothetical protein
MAESIWKRSFLKILSSTVHLFSIQVSEMAEDVASESTIRKWMSGKRFPYAAYQQKLLEYLRKRLSVEHSKGDYETLYDQIEDALSDVALNTARVIKIESNGNISELVIGAMHLCFMKTNEETAEQRAYKHHEVKQPVDANIKPKFPVSPH